MTKEQIRHNNDIWLSEEETFDENNIYSAMEDYAKQECIEFLTPSVIQLLCFNSRPNAKP